MADNQTPENALVQSPGQTVQPSGTGSTPTASPTNAIRNIIQTAQEREIVKTAPDIIVYLDGLPYLINSYLNDSTTGKEFVVVGFNDHVHNFSAGFDTDNLVPTGSVGLSVPNHQKYLYQSPGGNNLIQSMMEVQVFAKGYYLSKRGNSVYYRVFKGLTSHVTHTDNGKTLEIAIQCRGILRFLEMMQIDVQPSLQSNSSDSVTPYQTNQYNLDPYGQIADTFQRSVTFAGFQLNTIANKGQTLAGSDFDKAVKADYVAKWQTILNGVLADVHVMGYSLPSNALDAVTKDSTVIGHVDPSLAAGAISKKSDLKESDDARNAFVELIRGYTPDFKVSTVNLVNGGITPRLERIRNILHNIGFEGFQDLNGEIVFKAPLYNLDVTNLTAAPSNDKTLGPSPVDNIVDATNPFVVNLSEIEGESENEDEAAIRSTRMSIQGVFSRGLQLDVSPLLRTVASHIDIPKLAHFGLREEPARTVPWIENGDKLLMYTYAVNELVRSNRGYRTYSFTIPMRPELHLGFPMYIPHKDMYGYIKSISLNYQIAGASTMTILLDTIRKRPMFPSQRPAQSSSTTSSQTAQTTSTTILTTQPNLVMKWVKPSQTTTSSSTAASTAASTTTQSANGSSTGDTPSNDPSVNLVSNPATQLRPQDEPVYQEQLTMADYRKNQVGTDWSTRGDTKTHSFRVQLDSFGDGGQPFFSRGKWLPHGIDHTYYQQILTMQPFTDEKGYEVVGVFPLGRWKSLPEAYKETREGKVVDNVNPQAAVELNTTNAMLFAGLNCPQSGTSDELLKQFQPITNDVEQNSSFELEWTQPLQPGGDSSLTSNPQPDSQPSPDLKIATKMVKDLQQTVDMFINGTPQPLPATKQQLQIAEDDNTDTSFSSVLANFQKLVP